MNSRILDGKYEIIHEIKKGGFGIVYYGLDTNLNKPVAIKEIAPNLVEDSKYLNMFQEEALNIAKLSHNNIVHIYEFNKAPDGRLFIIMEYIDGKDLEKIIRALKKCNQRIPTHLAIYIISEICMALDYAHHRRDAFTNKPLNLVHQDISPSNIMISRYGEVKLIDFGIASVKRHRSKEKRDNKLRGKVPYMSPEQLVMGNHPDHRSDLFSLGLVLYETLVGERLFNNQEEVIAAGKNPKWFKKATKGKKLPSAIEKSLSKALEIDLSRRYQNANHMYIDLLQYLISCNETGELMDVLADYVNDLFNNGKYNPANIGHTTTRSERIIETDRRSTPSPLILNKWAAELKEHKPEQRPADSTQNPISDIPDSSQINLPSSSKNIEEEELKTVIDVIRISARNHKIRFIQFSVGLILGILIFTVFDIFKGWTKFGNWMYDHLFPPAIEIITNPPNATVYIDGEEIFGKTPLAIDKISPGVHKLQLEVAGYKSIVKSLFVPRKGDIQIQGQVEYSNQRNYLFNFNTEIEINSIPSGATVYLNGIRFNQKTPCTISLEVGQPVSIELEHNGFDRLTGYELNTNEGNDLVDDRRFWEMKVFNIEYTKYAITGYFKKDILINSVPTRVEIYNLDGNRLMGITGKKVAFKVGTYHVELRKNNFLPKKISLEINEDFNENVMVVLSRQVTFQAFDENEMNRQDIGANLVSLKRGVNDDLRNRRVTPFHLILPAFTYSALFQKEGYHSTEVTFGPETQLVQVEMEPMKAMVDIKVLDALSNQPVSDAEIYYQFAAKPENLDLFFDQTTTNGDAFGQIIAGQYIFTVKKIGYRTLTKSIRLNPGANESLIFKIYLSN